MDEKFILLRQQCLGTLKKIAAEKGISHLLIAEKSGLKPSNVSRLLNGKYSCTLDNLLKVAEAVGAKLIWRT